MIAKSADAPDDFAVAHVLAGAATAIGRHVQALASSTWSVGSNLFIALIGHKGAGKSSLAKDTFQTLVRHEQQLFTEAEEKIKAWLEGPCCGDFEEEEEVDDEDFDRDEAWSGDDGADDEDEDEGPPEAAPVIVTDVTGPAVVKVLELDPRQLLNHTDELASLFIRNTGGTDRQLFCELADGRRRRRSRATQRGQASAIESPHVCLLGCLTPDLLTTAYSRRGDDGLLDRFLLVGDGASRRASWPLDVHDPELAAAWSQLIDRLLRIEVDAMDAFDGKLKVHFDPAAIDRFKGCVERLNQVADAVRMPASQRGTVNKMKGFLPKLALIRRCLRWAVGEFGAEGPVGLIDVSDAEAACAAVEFFFGRWLLWRPELCAGLLPAGEPIGLHGDPGDEPALLDLARMADAAQSTVLHVERLVRYLRLKGGQASLTEMRAAGPMATATAVELEEAAAWLVEQGHATWADDGRAICLTTLAFEKTRKRRVSRQTATAR
jgi:energy-coupling factor transporter ATP-binding protein EcfA2